MPIFPDIPAQGYDLVAASAAMSPSEIGDPMTEVRSGQPATKRRVTAKLIIGLILIALALIFIFQNTSSREVHFLFWSFSAPTWIWLVIVLVIGVVIGSMFPWFRPKKKYVKG
jgi:uncharacterized integral membrane protein